MNIQETKVQIAISKLNKLYKDLPTKTISNNFLPRLALIQADIEILINKLKSYAG